MFTEIQPLLARTAEDMMSAGVILLREDMPLREAVRLLLQHRIGGAPVVNAEGVCVGVLSALDVLRLAERRADVAKTLTPPLPLTCSFQSKQTGRNGKERVLCMLPPGVCPIQRVQRGPDHRETVVCSQPHCVLVDWQNVELEKLPLDEVRQYMSADPVMVAPTAPIRDLARLMIDAHIHRVIVVNEEHKPIGVVTTTDLLAALANCEETVEADLPVPVI